MKVINLPSNKTNPVWAFFGTSVFSCLILDQMKSAGFLPKLIITTGDKPKGRKLLLTPPEVKLWAEKENIPYIQLKTLRNQESLEIIKSFAPDGFDVFIVASYGKILPQNILDLPKRKTINVHPSLLPHLRGPSPIQSAILTENETGVTIIRLDPEVDHGPIIAQRKILSWGWSALPEAIQGEPPYEKDLERTLGIEGGKLLSEILPDWVNGKIDEKEQDHTKATFCTKIEKSDGEINLSDSPEKNLRKIRAYHVWPTAYFFQNNTRIIIKKAHIENGKLTIDCVIPEGKKEMDYKDFLRGNKE